MKYSGMDLNECMDMEMDEFMDYLMNLDENEPTEYDLIKETGKSFDEVRDEFYEFNDYLSYIMNTYDIPMNTNLNFICRLIEAFDKSEITLGEEVLTYVNRFLNVENITNNHALIFLLIAFIGSEDYVMEFKKRKPFRKANGNIAKFLKVRMNMRELIDGIKCAKWCEREFDLILTELSNTDNDVQIKIEDKDREAYITSAFKEFIDDEAAGEIFEGNITYIDQLVSGNEQLAKIYPLAVWAIFIRNKSKIVNKELMVNVKNLFNYKEYEIRKDNGKNFKTNEKYLLLFLTLVDSWDKEGVSWALCVYGFEKISNLSNWALNSYRDADDKFRISLPMLINREWDVIFDGDINFMNYKFDLDDYIRYFKENKELCNLMREIIEDYLIKNNFLVEEYISLRSKNSSKEETFISKLSNEIIKGNWQQAKFLGDIDKLYMLNVIQEELQKKVNDRLKGIIVDMINKELE